LVIVASDEGAIDGVIDVGAMLGADAVPLESSLLPQAAIEIEKTVAAARAVSFIARMGRSSS
jgi:hypothetical protein